MIKVEYTDGSSETFDDAVDWDLNSEPAVLNLEDEDEAIITTINFSLVKSVRIC